MDRCCSFSCFLKSVNTSAFTLEQNQTIDVAENLTLAAFENILHVSKFTFDSNAKDKY